MISNLVSAGLGRPVTAIFAAGLLCGVGSPALARKAADTAVVVSTFVSGPLINPRGLKFGPDGNPTDPITGDFEPDGTWYSMISVRGALYAVEPNHGELDRITTDGNITRVIDISAWEGHVVPTVVAYHGNFYVSNLGEFDPDQLNTQSVFKITPSGQLKVVATGFSKVLGLTFDGRDRMYVLEASYSTSDPGPEPFTGRLVRIQPNEEQEVLIDSGGPLFFPTGMTFYPMARSTSPTLASVRRSVRF